MTRRAVLLIANAAAPYSRGLRVGRSLAAAGWEVEIAAVASPDQPADELDGAVRIRRYAPRGPWARFAHGAPHVHRPGIPGRLAHLAELGLKVLFWPAHVRGWWAALRADLEPADLYHAFGILTVPIALELGRAARRLGRAGRVVYDVIDIMFESNNIDRLPGPAVTMYRWRERRWIRQSDAIVTVNAALASYLERTWRLSERPVVLLNCPPRREASAANLELIRATTGLAATCRIAVFVGRLGPKRSLDEIAEAVLLVPDVALVLIGFGPWFDALRQRDGDPRFAGRHFTLLAVHPDDVPSWVAGADVSMLALPPTSLNQRLSTANKLWESIAAGTPLVVGRDLDVTRGIVQEHDLGAIADPADPADIARAIRVLIDAPEAVRVARRTRAVRLAHDRYNWEQAVVDYLALTDRLVPG